METGGGFEERTIDPPPSYYNKTELLSNVLPLYAGSANYILSLVG